MSEPTTLQELQAAVEARFACAMGEPRYFTRVPPAPLGSGDDGEDLPANQKHIYRIFGFEAEGQRDAAEPILVREMWGEFQRWHALAWKKDAPPALYWRRPLQMDLITPPDGRLKMRWRISARLVIPALGREKLMPWLESRSYCREGATPVLLA